MCALKCAYLHSILTPQSHHGEYTDLIQGCPLTILIQSGLPALLRYSIDEGSDSLQAAAIQCLHSLLITQAEEALLEDYYDCFAGLSLPALTPHSAGEKEEEEGKEKGGGGERESDDEVLKKDIVKVWKLQYTSTS